MGTLGGLAFSGEPALEYYMQEKPKRRDEQILTKEMLSQVFVTGSYTLLLSVVFLTSPVIRNIFYLHGGELAHLTAFYALFIFAGIFNCFGARCERMWIFSNIGKNKPFIFIMALICVIQIVMIYYGGSLFRTCALSAGDLMNTIILAFSVIPFEIIRRIFFKLTKNKESAN